MRFLTKKIVSLILFFTINEINGQVYRVYKDDKLGFVLNECNETEDNDWFDADEPKLIFDYTSLYVLGIAIVLFLLFLG